MSWRCISLVAAITVTACSAGDASDVSTVEQAVEPADSGKGWPKGGELISAYGIEYGATGDGLGLELQSLLARSKTFRPVQGEIFLQSRVYKPSPALLADFDKAIAAASDLRMKKALTSAREALAAGHSVTVKEADTSVVALDDGSQRRYGVTAVYKSRLRAVPDTQNVAPKSFARSSGQAAPEEELVLLVTSEGEVLRRL